MLEVDEQYQLQDLDTANDGQHYDHFEAVCIYCIRSVQDDVVVHWTRGINFLRR